MTRFNAQGQRLLRRMLATLIDDATRVLVRLGRRLGRPALATIPVSAVMLSRMQTVSVEQPLEDVAQLMVAGRHAELPLVAEGVPVGVVTRSDVTLGLARSGRHSPVGEAPRHHAITVAPSESLADVLQKLQQAPESVAIVVDRGTPVGMLTAENLTRYAADV
ncbi:MAG: CBS domain-containing protein [Kofleriaceae bacterium]